MKIKLLLMILFSGFSINAQTLEWYRAFSGTQNDGGRSIVTDASGNVYTTGYFQGTVDFDPGIGTTNLTAEGSSDVFIQKMDADGNFLWAKSFGGTLLDIATSICIDASGNIYTTGYYDGTVDFDPGIGVANWTTGGLQDVFVQKLDTNGNFIWVRSFGGTSTDTPNSISLDSSGNVYTTGFFQGNVDFDPGLNSTNFTAQSSDIFIHKMDSDGNFLWVKPMGGTGVDIGYSTKIDGLGNIYTIGYFGAMVDFDPGAGINAITSQGQMDIFVQKMDAAGNFVWVRSFGGSLTDYGYFLTLDGSGNIYTCGSFQDTVDFNPGTGSFNLTSVGVLDVFVQKMDTDGNFLWAKSFGGDLSDNGYSVKVDNLGNVYSTGTFQNTADFDPGIDVNNLTSMGSQDWFVQKLDQNGNFLWARTFGSSSSDNAYSIDLDASGKIYTTGGFQETMDFDPGSGVSNLTSGGSFDIYVHKMSQAPLNSTDRLQEINVAVYPNPTQDKVSLLFEEQLQDVEITLKDLFGRTISKDRYDSLISTAIEIPDANGIYFLTIQTNKNQKVIKLVKE